MTGDMLKKIYPFIWEEQEMFRNKAIMEDANRNFFEHPSNEHLRTEFILPEPDRNELKLIDLEQRVEALENKVPESSLIIKPTDEQIKLFGNENGKNKNCFNLHNI